MKAAILKPPSANACRCLFGTPDPKENIRMLKDQLEKQYKQFSDRWNIDPENNKVWKGRYVWSVLENRSDNNNEKSVKCTGPVRIRLSDQRSSTHPYHQTTRQTSITEYLRIRRNATTAARKTSAEKSTPDTMEPSILVASTSS